MAAARLSAKLSELPLCAHHRASPACPVPCIGRSIVHLGGWRSSALARTRPCEALAPHGPPPLRSMDLDCEEVMQRLHNTVELRNCFGHPLSLDEQHSLVRCLDSAQLGVDTCLVDGLPALHEHLMKYCRAVASTQTDDLELVEGAMLLIEQLSLSLGHAMPSEGSQPRFNGQWQMLVATGGGWPFGRLQYVPIIELLEVSEDGQTFRLESKAGPLYTLAIGEVTWLRPPNHLQYHVSEFRLELLGGSMAMAPPATDNELLVFATAPGIALARSSSGGMTLMGQPV